MPVKRRVDKRRLAPEAEAEAWRDYFESGYDFFGAAAEACGLVEPVNVWPPEDRPAAQNAWDAAAADAWRRIGHLLEVR